MNRRNGEKAEARFAAYVQGLSSVLGHADRIGPLRDYCTGLILPGERKSVEPMAAKTAPARTAAQHQSLLPGSGPRRRGRPLNNTGRRDEPDLISAKRLARNLPKHAWRTIRWREGSA